MNNPGLHTCWICYTFAHAGGVWTAEWGVTTVGTAEPAVWVQFQSGCCHCHPLVAGVAQPGHHCCPAWWGRLLFVGVCFCVCWCVCKSRCCHYHLSQLLWLLWTQSTIASLLDGVGQCLLVRMCWCVYQCVLMYLLVSLWVSVHTTRTPLPLHWVE